MKVINISDIEDLISAKIEIDNLRIVNNEITEKTQLTDFMNNYINMGSIFLNKGKNVPFKLLNLYKKTFLFVIEDKDSDNIKRLIQILIKHKYDLSTFEEIDLNTLAETYGTFDKIEVIMKDNKYYKV